MRRPAGIVVDSAPDIPGIQTARNRRIRRAFDDGAPVGEESEFVWLAPEFQHEVVVANVAQRLEPRADLGKIDWPLAFMDLHGITSAERDVRSTFTRQVREIAFAAGTASGARHDSSNLCFLVCPKIPGQ